MARNTKSLHRVLPAPPNLALNIKRPLSRFLSIFYYVTTASDLLTPIKANAEDHRHNPEITFLFFSRPTFDSGFELVPLLIILELNIRIRPQCPDDTASDTSVRKYGSNPTKVLKVA